LAKEVESLESRKQTIMPKDFIVTDHAFVRYFERVLDCNIEEIRKNIISELKKNPDIIFGFKTTVKDNTLITILPKDCKNT
jgi:hypothetical protein